MGHSEKAVRDEKYQIFQKMVEAGYKHVPQQQQQRENKKLRKLCKKQGISIESLSKGQDDGSICSTLWAL
jgi:hypothetical protein